MLPRVRPTTVVTLAATLLLASACREGFPSALSAGSRDTGLDARADSEAGLDAGGDAEAGLDAGGDSEAGLDARADSTAPVEGGVDGSADTAIPDGSGDAADSSSPGDAGGCPPTTDDCDLDPTSGCETSLLTNTDCGSCGTPCSLPGAITSCASGTCELVACQVGRGDCDGVASNGCEGSAMHFWPDGDGDSWGDIVTSTYYCSPPYPMTGWVTRSGDCDDGDPRAFPGQTTFFAGPRTGGGWDYDCNGAESYRFRDMMTCIAGASCFISGIGWRFLPPPCGVTADWVTDCTGTDPCTLTSEGRTQMCR